MHQANGHLQARPSHDFMSPHVWSQLQAALDLSARELDIVQLLCTDCSEAEMACHLGISRHTVHTYLQRLYLKLDVSGRVGVVVRLFAAHLVLFPHQTSADQASTARASAD